MERQRSDSILFLYSFNPFAFIHVRWSPEGVWWTGAAVRHWEVRLAAGRIGGCWCGGSRVSVSSDHLNMCFITLSAGLPLFLSKNHSFSCSVF
jgi:hypothetical protein